jgi:hypothetical protein
MLCGNSWILKAPHRDKPSDLFLWLGEMPRG